MDFELNDSPPINVERLKDEGDRVLFLLFIIIQLGKRLPGLMPNHGSENGHAHSHFFIRSVC